MKPNTVILGWPNQWRKREEDSWRVFVDTIRNTAAAKMALLVPKGTIWVLLKASSTDSNGGVGCAVTMSVQLIPTICIMY